MLLNTKKYFSVLLIFIFPLVLFGHHNKTISTEDFKNIWHLDYKGDSSTSSIFEWTKADENVYNWTELISAHIFKTPFYKAIYCREWLSLIKNKIPKKLWNEQIIFEDQNSIFLTWAISPPSPRAENEWAKIIETEKGLFLVRYTVKPNVKADQKWIDFVKNALYENNFLTSE